MDNLDLSFFFKTKAEANEFAVKLKQIGEKIYQTDFNLEKALSESLGLRKKDKFMALLTENKIDISQSTALKEFLDKLEGKVAALPVLAMTIAFEPDEKTLEIISEWFLINIKKQSVFDITVDRNLIAGAAIFYNGKYLDYTVRQKVTEIIATGIKSASAKKPEVAHQSTDHMTLAR